MSIILGIDPGSRITGYGIIACSGGKQQLIAYGDIRTQSDNTAERLSQIFSNLCTIIQQYQPEEAAIEQVFMHQNPQSALKLGQARGAALVAMASHALPIGEYSPRAIKQALVGYGAASKAQVQHMVCSLLNIKQKVPADAADALAIALCHEHSSRTQRMLKKATITAGVGS